MHLHGSRCCSTCLCKKSAHPHVITCLIVRCLSTHWSLPLFRVFPHLVQSLHLLYSAHPPCGRNRRVQETSCAPAEWGVLPCGGTQPSHNSGRKWSAADIMAGSTSFLTSWVPGCPRRAQRGTEGTRFPRSQTWERTGTAYEGLEYPTAETTNEVCKTPVTGACSWRLVF